MIGLLCVCPVVFKVKAQERTGDRTQAVQRFGPELTAVARRSLKFWVPEISNASEFDLFRHKMKARFRLWKPLFDITVVAESRSAFKLKIANCPFCEALDLLGYPELRSYICQADWEVAAKNSDKWAFKRRRQIGTDDAFCDHTYLKINS